MKNHNIILHIPHSSILIPSDCQFLISKSDLELEIHNMTDHKTDTLFVLEGARRIVFPVSRLVVDPERFIEDSMESVGMGVVYTHTADGRPLRRISNTDRQVLIDTYYHPHHSKLTEMVDACLAEYDSCLIIDCHSFSSHPLPYEQDTNRPDICIGTCDFHTSEELMSSLSEGLSSKGYEVAINSPYSGTIVPLKHYYKEPRVSSVMIEVNRRLYSNTADYLRLQKDLSNVMSQLSIISTKAPRAK
jgi:N-formylglutamate deformylase